MKRTALTPFIFSLTLLVVFSSSCENEIDDIPRNPLVGKWEYSRLVWDSAGGNYKATREAIRKDLHNKWKDVEKGAFSYELTSNGKFFYNNEYRGQYTYTGSGIIITNVEDGKYIDKGSFQYSFEGNELHILHNLASEYRNEDNIQANIDILKSIGVTTNLSNAQYVDGAWVKLAFEKIN